MKNETIVDRVVERLKAQPLGDLITEEDLHEIVKSAIPKVFFEKRDVVIRDNYRTETKTIEPALIEIMRELLQASAKKYLESWMVDNAEIIVDHWKKVIHDGLLTYVQKLQDERATQQIKSVLNVLLQPINAERARNGQLQQFTKFIH